PKTKGVRGAAVRRRRSESSRWLGAEIELMMRERERLLRAAGAAANLFTALDIRVLPDEARRSLCRLAATLASLSDETLTDAMEHALDGDSRSRLRATS